MSVDLRSLLKKFGGGTFRDGIAAVTDRVDATEGVVVLDQSPLEVTADPAVLTGFVDGIQSTLTLTHRSQRPVYLFYVAAACVGSSPVALSEQLGVLASPVDFDWLTSEMGVAGVPLVALDGSSPPELEMSARNMVGGLRDRAERDVVDVVLASPGDGVVVVDGSLIGRPRHNRLVGVVKSVGSQYLSDESVIWHLPPGWRSPRFQVGGGSVPRFSMYVQLAPKHDRAWNHGMIRVESWDLDLLEPVAAAALGHRQSARSGDFRWDRHLAGVRRVEDYLRSRRPVVFSW